MAICDDQSSRRLMKENRRYTLAEFACLWCGVHERDVATVLAHAEPVGNNKRGQAILRSNDIACLEAKMTELADILESENSMLIDCDESGRERDSHIAWDRKHISGKRGREFFRKYCAEHNEPLPEFLFTREECEGSDIAEALRAQKDKNRRLTETAEELRKTIRDLQNNLRNEQYRSESLLRQIEMVKQSSTENHDPIKALSERFAGKEPFALRVVRWMCEGQTPEGIALRLFNKGNHGMSRSQIGALFYNGIDTPAENTVQVFGGSLVDKVNSGR